MKKNIFLLWTLNRFYLFLVAGFAVLYLPLRERPGITPVGGHFNNPFLDAWTRWDAGWYVSIAENGYHFVQGKQSNVAFFPLYPLTIKLLSLIFRDTYITGIIVSNLAFLIGIIFFQKLLKEYLLKDEDKIKWGILFLLFYPYSFFFSAPYSESLFFMCAVLCFYSAEKKNWMLSALFGMLASADRFVGIALFPAIVVRYWETISTTCHNPLAFQPTPLIKGDRWVGHGGQGRHGGLPLQLSSGGEILSLHLVRHVVPLLFIGMIPLGLIGYMAFLYIKFGDPLAFAHTIGQGWEGMKILKPDILLPFKSCFNTIVHFSQLPNNKYHVLFQFPIFIFFLVLIFYSFKYLGFSYGIFSLVMLAIPASVSKDLIGMGRYLLVLFPCFAVIPEVIKSKNLRILLLAFSFFFLTLFTTMFATWWWVG